jgi:biotin operon repressor
MGNEEAYVPMTREELRVSLGISEEEINETIASLVEKGLIKEHHDGGFTFNPLILDFILLNQDPENQKWIG